jgi:hypothetical protein
MAGPLDFERFAQMHVAVVAVPVLPGEDLVRILPSSRPPRVLTGAARAPGLTYALFDSLLRSRFGLGEGPLSDESAVLVREKLADVLDDRRVGDVGYFLGGLMGLTFPESPFTKAVSEDAGQARLIRRAVLRSFIEADARHGPLCLVLDDLADADEDSLDLLLYLLEETKGPVLFLCLARPELLSRHARWVHAAGSRHDLVELGPVPSGDARAIMQALLGPCEGGPPDRLVDAGLGMAGGNPGLLSHMVRIFHDSGVLRDAAEEVSRPLWRVDLDRLAQARLPLTLEDAAVTSRWNLLTRYINSSPLKRIKPAPSLAVRRVLS